MNISFEKIRNLNFTLGAAAFSFILFILSLLNLHIDRLADIDFDTAHAVYGMMFDEASLSRHPAILHPALKFIYLPFQFLYKSGFHPLTALQIHYGIFTTASAVLFGLLCFRLTENVPFSFLMFGSFCYFPAVQVIIQTMDDNLYAYPFLFSGLILSFSKEKLSSLNIYLRFVSSVILFSIMIFTSMTLFPFVIFLSFLFLIRIFSDLEFKQGLRLLTAVVLTGIGTALSFYFIFSMLHGLSGKALLDETLGWSTRFSADVSALAGNYSRMDFLKASLWNGLFSIPRSETVISELGFMLSFISGKSKSSYLVLYLLLYFLFIIKLAVSCWKEKSFKNFLYSVNLMILMAIGLGFIFWFQDMSFHERWDFFYLALPWTVFLAGSGKKRSDIIILSLFIMLPLFFGFKIFYNAKENFSGYRSVKAAEPGYGHYVFTQNEISDPVKSVIHIMKNYSPLLVIKTQERPEKEKPFLPLFLIEKHTADEKIKSLKRSEVFVSKDAEKLLK